MMINKRLISMVGESKKYVAGNVVFQWCSLAGNIAMMTAIASLLAALPDGGADSGRLGLTAGGGFAAARGGGRRNAGAGRV